VLLDQSAVTAITGNTPLLHRNSGLVRCLVPPVPLVPLVQ
jgi:hypothetical protein